MWHAEVATGQTKQIFVSGSATTKDNIVVSV